MSRMRLLADRRTALAPPVARSLLSPGPSCAKAASVAFAAEQVDNRNRDSAMAADGNARMPICDLLRPEPRIGHVELLRPLEDPPSCRHRQRRRRLDPPGGSDGIER